MVTAWAALLAALTGGAQAAPAARPAAAASAPAELVDVASPEAVAAALQRIGYRGAVKRSDDGAAYVESAAGGNTFTVEFYDCKNGRCDSVQLQSFYKAEPLFTPALANEWNNGKRFLRVSVDAKGDLREWVDLSTKGQLTRENFADVIAWYEQMDGELGRFLRDKREAAKKPA